MGFSSFYGNTTFKLKMTQGDVDALKAIETTSAGTLWTDDKGANWKQYYNQTSGREAVEAVFHRPFLDSTGKFFSLKTNQPYNFQSGFFIGSSPVNTSYENASSILVVNIVESANDSSSSSSSSSSAYALTMTLAFAATSAMLLI